MVVRTPGELSSVQEIREHRGLFTALGVGLIILGALAFVAAFAFTMAAVLMLGWLLIVGGIVQIVQAIRGTQHGNAGWTIAAGILYMLAGAWLAWHPMVGALSLTLILAGFLIVSGIVRFVHSFQMRARNTSWGWLAAGGVIDVVLGILIWAHWPVTALWVLGVFLGIDMIYNGAAWIALANTPQRFDRTLTTKTPVGQGT